MAKCKTKAMRSDVCQSHWINEYKKNSVLYKDYYYRNSTEKHNIIALCCCEPSSQREQQTVELTLGMPITAYSN
jgi:hypothetical protein